MASADCHLTCPVLSQKPQNKSQQIFLYSSTQNFPDTFASKAAAIDDETADASVGNVTGSNAVNVFLGIGIAWTMAAIYWESQGKSFEVSPGSLTRHRNPDAET